jgi:hypothetical protein
VQLALRAAYAGLIRKGARVSASAPPGARESRTCWSRRMKGSGLMDDEDRVYADADFAQMRLSQKSGKHPLGTRMTWEEDPSIDARQSLSRPKDADLRRARLAQSGDRIRAAAKRTFGSKTPLAERGSEDGLPSRAENSKQSLSHD